MAEPNWEDVPVVGSAEPSWEDVPPIEVPKPSAVVLPFTQQGALTPTAPQKMGLVLEPEAAPADLVQLTGDALEARQAETDPKVAKRRAAWEAYQDKRARILHAFDVAQRSNLDEDQQVLGISKALNVETQYVRPNLAAFKRSAEAAAFDPDRWEVENYWLAKLVLEHPELGSTVVNNKELTFLMKGWNAVRDWATRPVETEQLLTGDRLDAARRNLSQLDEMESKLASAGGLLPPAQQETRRALQDQIARAEGRAPGAIPGPDDSAAGEQNLAFQEASAAFGKAKAARDKPVQVTERESPEAAAIREQGLVGIELQRRRETKAQHTIMELSFKRMQASMRGDTAALPVLDEQIHNAKVRAVPLALGEGPWEQTLTDAVQGTQSSVSMLERSVKYGGTALGMGALVGGAIGGAATRTPGGVVTGARIGVSTMFPLAKALGVAGAVEGSFILEAGSTYDELDDVRTEAGQALTEDVRIGAAYIAGAAKTALELLELQQMLKAFGPVTAGLKAGSIAALKEALTRDPKFRQLAAKAGRQALKSAVIEGGEEGAQEMADEGVAYLAKSKQDLAWQAGPVLDPQQVLEATGKGLLGALPLAGLGVGTQLAGRLIVGSKEARGAKQVPALFALATDKTVQAAPAEFAKMVQDSTAEGGSIPVTALHVDARAVVRYYQEQGVDPAKGVAEVLGPQAAQRLTEALATGGRLEIPMVDVLAKWAPSEAGKALVADTATQALYATPRQLAEGQGEAVQKEAEAIAKAEMAKQAQLVTASTELERLGAELIATDRATAKAARATVALWKHFYETQAFGSDMTPEQLAQRFRVTFGMGEVEPAEFMTRPPDEAASQFLSKRWDTASRTQRLQDFFQDPITGAFNRLWWDVQKPTAFLVADVSVEGIKFENDQKGHQWGDNVYRAAAQALKAAGAGGVAKVGGDFKIADVTQEQLDALLAKANESPGLHGFKLTGQVAAGSKEAAKIHRALKKEMEESTPPRRAPRGGQPLGAEAAGLTTLHAPITSTDEGSADFQTGPEHQAAFDALRPEDAFNAAFVEASTGLLTELGRDKYLALNPKTYRVSIDVNGIAEANRELGERGADLAVIEGFGRTVVDAGGHEFLATHAHGDEYTLDGDDLPALKAFVDRLTAVAEGARFDLLDDAGNLVVTINGLVFGAGVGKGIDAAEKALNVHKAELTAAGKRGEGKFAARLTRPDVDAADRGVRQREGSASGPDEHRGTQLVARTGLERGTRQRYVGAQARPLQATERRGVADLRPGVREGVARPPSRSEHDAAAMQQARSESLRFSPANRKKLVAFLDFVEGWDKGAPRPAAKLSLSPTQLRMLADRFGIVDPELGFHFDLATGRDISPKTGTGAGGRRLSQLEDGAPKGYTEILSTALGKAIGIFLNKEADASTLAHESAHAFLEMLGEMAAAPSATDRQKEVLRDALKALGADSIASLTREQHEKFARGFEAWLMEGKSPSKALERTFQRFKLWLLSIYKTVRNLNVELNADLRSVYERLLATDEEIRRHRGLEGPGLFSSADEAGMSQDEWQAEQDAEALSDAFASRKAELYAMKDRLRETEAWYKEALAEHLAAGREAFEQLPARRAQLLLEGKAPGVIRGQPVVLDRELVDAAVGAAARKHLATSKDGAHPDSVSDLAGYATGEAMLRDIVALPPREAWVARFADAQMAALYPSVLDEREKLRALVAGGLSEVTEKRLLRNLTELHRRAKVEATPIDQVRLAARLIAQRTPIGRLNPGWVLGLERKLATEAHRAAAQGEWMRALDAARRQLLNASLYRELLKARERRDAAESLAADMSDTEARARLGLASPVLRDAVDWLLGAVGLRAERPDLDVSTIDKAARLLEADGSAVGDWAELVPVIHQRRNAWGELTVEEMDTVVEALKQMRNEARFRTSVILDETRAERADVVARFLPETASVLPKKPPPATPSARTLGEKTREALSDADSFLRGAEDLIGDLVNGDQTSVAWRAFIAPIQRAKHLEADLLKSVFQPILEAFNAMPKDMKGRFMDKVDGAALFPGHTDKAAPPRRRFELLMMALNAGNAGNLQRLLDGRSITAQQLLNALNLLSAEELAWVQSVWDSMESLRELAFDLEERDSGLRPQAVEATPLVLANGSLRGGYFPAVYMRTASQVGERQAPDTVAGLFDQTYTRPGTSNSALKARAEKVTAVIDLEPDSITRHLQQVVHDIAFREPVKSVGSLLLAPEVDTALKERLGPVATRRLLQWLRDVAQMRGQQMGSIFDKAIQWQRSNLAPALLGWSAPVALGDLANVLASVPTAGLKPSYIGSAFAAYSEAPALVAAEARAMSGELRFMDDVIKRDFAHQMRSLTAEGIFAKGPLAWMKEHAFFFMEQVQRNTSIPLWLAAFNQAQAEGRGEAQAVDWADGVLRRVFPSHSAVDQAAIMRDKGFWGASTVFYGYLSVLYRASRNLTRPLFTKDFGEANFGGKVKTVALVSGSLLALHLTAGVMAELLMGRGPEDEDRDEEEPDSDSLKWARWTRRKLISSALNTVPLGMGQFYEQAVLGRQYNPRPQPFIDYLGQLGKAAMTLGDEDADGYAKFLALLKMVAYTKGVSLKPFTAPGRYLWDVGTGEETPDGVLDILSGLFFGQRESQPENIFTLGRDQ